jgi:hypothetical protein
MASLDELKGKYASVLELIQKRNVRLEHVNMEGDKLFLQGAAPNDAVKNQIWDQIKTVDANFADLTCDLSIDGSIPAPADDAPPTPAAPAAEAPKTTTYTVEAGDSLWTISEKFLGAGHLFKKIVEANPDTLEDEHTVIHPGDVLNIPAKD